MPIAPNPITCLPIATRRVFSLSASLVAFAIVCIASPHSFAADEPSRLNVPTRPNVIVFLVDDMGMMDTSVPFITDEQGVAQSQPLNDFYRTPSMERLAKQGIRYNQFYAMSVCSPTRIAIMTGQTSARHHSTQWIRPESNNRGMFGPKDWKWVGITAEQTTLPQLLSDNGYRTIHCGKAHFGCNDSYAEFPTAFGFDINIAGRAIGAPGSYYAKQNFGNAKDSKNHHGVRGLDKYHGSDLFLTEVLTTEVNEAIEAAVNDKKPFFAYMAHYAVHAPFEADPRFVKNYQGTKDQPTAANLAAFGSMVEGMDKSLGDILDKLDQLGVAENTMVFFVGDNGTDAPRGHQYAVSCAAPLRGKKGTHYEGGMRVPFIAAWAKPASENPNQKLVPIAQGKIRTNVAAIYDLFPTILAATGVNSDQTIDGVNLLEQLDGTTGGGEREFLMHFPHDHRSSYFTVYRRGDWKLVYHYYDGLGDAAAQGTTAAANNANVPKATNKGKTAKATKNAKNANRRDESPTTKGKRYELFQLADDPYESNDLSASEPEQLRVMLDAMRAALAATGAQMPLGADQQTPLAVLDPE